MNLATKLQLQIATSFDYSYQCDEPNFLPRWRAANGFLYFYLPMPQLSSFKVRKPTISKVSQYMECLRCTQHSLKHGKPTRSQPIMSLGLSELGYYPLQVLLHSFSAAHSVYSVYR
ncbi:BA75_05250T0 [Komagataella pastoris]|uniref:BA75_05250T0 n=1 Tax=Komagataella pastoris TaxID=4922 RepID=A0A1B2JIZ5_PICPA|nr:BA75_05250T0 [Komagataella pastoris]